MEIKQFPATPESEKKSMQALINTYTYIAYLERIIYDCVTLSSAMIAGYDIDAIIDRVDKRADESED